MEFQMSYIKSKKMMLWKCCIQCQQIWKTQQWPQDWKKSVFISIPMKGNAKVCLNYSKIALTSHAGKIMLKILQARLQYYMNSEPPDIQDGFRKGRGTRDQIVNTHWIIEKAREFQKNIYFCFIDYVKASDSVDHNKSEKFLTVMGIPDRLTCLLRNLYAGQELNSWNRTWNNRPVTNCETSMSKLYIVILLI